MTSKNTHVQCKLERDGKFSTRWLPAKYAEVGKSVVISEDGENKEFWTVSEVYDSMSSAYINERSQDYKRTRKASDV